MEYPVAKDPFAYLAESQNTLLIVARTIYVLREGTLATKEEAISYVKSTYPSLRCVADGLPQLYMGHRTTPTEVPSSEQMENFLTQGETAIRSFLAANSTGKIT
jgi:hypothetical protein